MNVLVKISIVAKTYLYKYISEKISKYEMETLNETNSFFVTRAFVGIEAELQILDMWLLFFFW